MNNINIKDYLKTNLNKSSSSNKQSTYHCPTFTYKILLDNGSDVIIRRTSGTGIQRDFSIIPSDNLVFIRDVKKGTDKFVVDKGQINSFFQDVPHNLFKKFKNDYWHCEYFTNFAPRVLSMKDSDVVREFIKKG